MIDTQTDWKLTNSDFVSGNTKTLLSDKRDIGRFVARIIRDPRTLNRSVVAWSDEISQNEIISLIKAKTGETPTVFPVSAGELDTAIDTALRMVTVEPKNMLAWMKMNSGQYDRSKWIRADGTLENAKYLGYIDARELYPDLQPVRFEQFLDELVQGKATRPYDEMATKVSGGDTKKLMVLRVAE